MFKYRTVIIKEENEDKLEQYKSDRLKMSELVSENIKSNLMRQSGNGKGLVMHSLIIENDRLKSKI